MMATKDNVKNKYSETFKDKWKHVLFLFFETQIHVPPAAKKSI